jgi:catechol-2,3-dioxygenase
MGEASDYHHDLASNEKDGSWPEKSSCSEAVVSKR